MLSRKSGPCFGGPANTMRLSVICDLGFLWVDETINWVWIYNWNDIRRGYIVADPDGQEIAPDPDNGVVYGVENEDSYTPLFRPSHPPTLPQD